MQKTIVPIIVWLGFDPFRPVQNHKQRGNIQTCLMMNRKGSRQCQRIEVQSKETPVVEVAIWFDAHTRLV